MEINDKLHISDTIIVITQAGIAVSMGGAFSRVWQMSVCPCSNRKTAWGLELSTPNSVHILYSSHSVARPALTQRWKGHRSRSQYQNCHGRTVVSGHCRHSLYLCATVLPAAFAGVGLYVDMTAYVFLVSSISPVQCDSILSTDLNMSHRPITQ